MPPSTTLPIAAPSRVLACGAFLKNRACLVDGVNVLWSDMHGDLGDARACAALESSVEALLAQAHGPVQAIAHDLHPDFHSTRVALAMAERLQVPAIGVQHHHAHIAAVQAELGLRGPVVGVALDGIGLGSDGKAWGGELLWVGEPALHWQRIAHLHPLALPGGDVAAHEPWRMASAVLHSLGRGDQIEARFAPAVGAQSARVLARMLHTGLNCPTTTSAGRWFDAAAAALGLSVRQHGEAEAAMALEHEAGLWLAEHPDFDHPFDSLDLRSVVAALFEVDRHDKPVRARAAAGFHLALANGLAQAAITAARAHRTRHVVLGGGCFMNHVLRERLTQALQRAGLSVHAPLALSCGDAGLALGQAWVAAATLQAAADDDASADHWARTQFLETES